VVVAAEHPPPDPVPFVESDAEPEPDPPLLPIVASALARKSTVATPFAASAFTHASS